eukprot:TRINITY_DN8294_c0_g2_i3.p2 TRINITY_DN8294_c0_g2~~TRINITY_DN8294_c0_g2_i3.p2  ORF type:complete len:131 (+),score=21.35 TRINITY_DN8294_c0_g2_i3:676-1068(+)
MSLLFFSWDRLSPSPPGKVAAIFKTLSEIVLHFLNDEIKLFKRQHRNLNTVTKSTTMLTLIATHYLLNWYENSCGLQSPSPITATIDSSRSDLSVVSSSLPPLSEMSISNCEGKKQTCNSRHSHWLECRL